MAVFIALLSALGFALGNVFQKKGLSHLAGMRAIWKETLMSGYWWLGMSITATAVILQYVATDLFPLSLVQPIICLNPILSILIAKYFLKEKAHPKSYWSLLFFSSGILLFALNPQDTSNQFMHYQSFLMISGGILCVLLLWKSVRADLKWAILAGLGFGLSPLLFKGMMMDLHQIPNTGLGTIFSLLTQSPSLLLFVIIYFFSFGASQTALYHGKISTVVPIYAGLGAIHSIVAGIVVFGEQLSLLNWIALGLLFLALLCPKEA